jgi:hypothetical protein
MNSDEMAVIWQQIYQSYETHFLPRLRELTEMPHAGTKTMFEVMDYLYWANYSDLPLKFDLT